MTRRLSLICSILKNGAGAPGRKRDYRLNLNLEAIAAFERTPLAALGPMATRKVSGFQSADGDSITMRMSRGRKIHATSKAVRG